MSNRFKHTTIEDDFHGGGIFDGEGGEDESLGRFVIIDIFWSKFIMKIKNLLKFKYDY